MHALKSSLKMNLSQPTYHPLFIKGTRSLLESITEKAATELNKSVKLVKIVNDLLKQIEIFSQKSKLLTKWGL